MFLYIKIIGATFLSRFCLKSVPGKKRRSFIYGERYYCVYRIKIMWRVSDMKLHVVISRFEVIRTLKGNRKGRGKETLGYESINFVVKLIDVFGRTEFRVRDVCQTRTKCIVSFCTLRLDYVWYPRTKLHRYLTHWFRASLSHVGSSVSTDLLGALFEILEKFESCTLRVFWSFTVTW